MDASLISRMKAIENENRRLKRKYADQSMQADLLKEAVGKVTRPSQRPEMAENAVARRGAGVVLACRAFELSGTFYRYGPKLRRER